MLLWINPASSTYRTFSNQFISYPFAYILPKDPLPSEKFFPYGIHCLFILSGGIKLIRLIYVATRLSKSALQNPLFRSGERVLESLITLQTLFVVVLLRIGDRLCLMVR
ncbi:hypothetical protein D3C73_804290 [compost metagenome]